MLKGSIYIILCLFLIASASAAIDDGLQHYYNFNISNPADWVGGVNGTVVDYTHVSTGGVLDGYAHFDGIDDVITLDGTDQLDNAGGMTVNFWVNGSAAQGSAADIFSYGHPSNSNGIYPIGATATATMEQYLRTATSVVKIGGTASTGDVWGQGWTMYSITWAHSGGNTYWNISINGTKDHGSSFSSFTFGFTQSAIGALRRASANVNFADGDIDELGIWNRTLTQSELGALFTMYTVDGCNPINNVTCGVPAPSNESSITLTWDLVSGTTVNTNPYVINWTGTPINGQNSSNCNITQNGALFDFIEGQDIRLNYSSSSTVSGVNGAVYNYSLSCNNVNATATISGWIYVDTVGPEANLTYLREGKTYFYNITASGFKYNITVWDPNLLAANFTLKNPSGTVIQNYFRTNITGTTADNETRYNLQGQELGQWTLQVQAWDDHTAQKIKDYLIKDDTRFGFRGYNIDDDIWIYGDDAKKIDFYKEDDRYNFTIDFKKKDSSIYVYAPDLIPRTDSGYPGHFVSLAAGKWIDFNSDTPLSITSLGEGHYQVSFQTDDAKKINFKSIGDLNTYDVTYNFTLSDSMYVYAYDIETDTTINTFTVNASNENISLFDTATSGYAIFNYTSQTWNLTVAADGFLTETRENIAFAAGYQYNVSMNASNAFTVYIRDQTTNNLITGQNVNLEFIGTNSSNYTTSTGVEYITDLAPDDYIVRYDSAGYSTGLYYFTLVNGTNVQFTIYMLPGSGATNVSLYVYDEDSTPVEYAQIIVYRYLSVLNSYVAVNNLRTDFEGKSIAPLSVGSEFYKFYVYYNNELKLETQGAYITSNEVSFNIVLQDSVLEEFFTLQDVTGYLNFNENTRNFRFYYNDPSSTVSEGCLELYQQTVYTETLYNSTCTSGTSALILLNAENISGMTYLARAYVNISGTNQLFATYSYTFGLDTPKSEGGVWIVLLMTLVFAMLFLWDPTAGMIAIGLPAMIGSLPFLRWIDIDPFFTIGVEVILIVLALWVRKR